MAAIVLGVSAANNTQTAFLLLLFAGLATAVAIRPSAVLMVLIVSVLIEILAVGGVAMNRLLAPVALIVTMIGLFRGFSLRMGPPLVWVAGYSIWALTSSFWTVDFGETSHALGALAISLVYMLAFGVLLDSAQDLKRTIGALAFGAFVVGCFALSSFIQSGGQSDPANGDPTAFATYQIIAIPPVLALASQAHSRALRTTLYVVVGVLIGSVGASLSRGGIVVLFGVALLLLLVPARSIFRSRRHKLTVLACIVASGAIVFTVTSAELVPRLDTIFGEGGDGGSGRTDLWRAAQTSINERPGLGLGLGGFGVSSNSLLVRTPGVDLASHDLRETGLVAHNAFLGTFADLGIVGLVLFVGLVVSTARLLRRTANRARDVGEEFVSRAANAFLIGLAGWAIASMFISSELSRPIWILVGVALGLPKLIDAKLPERATAATVGFSSPNGHPGGSAKGEAPHPRGERQGRP